MIRRRSSSPSNGGSKWTFFVSYHSRA